MAFLEFTHILRETSKPTTDNKSVTRFFQTKAIPPSLWNACDYVLQFNFKIAHITGSVNNAADFLSRLELKVTEKIHLKIREDVQRTPIEVSTSSSDVADEEQIFFTHPDSQDETEEQILRKKKTISEKCSRMGNKPGTILIEAKHQGIYKDRRKHYVVFQERNQSKCKNTSRARCGSCSEEYETQIFGPTT